jgi:hypothetical protein
MCDPHRTHEEDKKHGFPGLDLKTGGNSLMLWTLKSLRYFLGLGLKIKRRRFVCLCLNTDEQMKTV